MFSDRSDRTSSAGPRQGALVEVVHGRLADEAFNRYLEWRDECATVDAAYRNWSDAPKSDGAFAYAAFVAALEREEHAAGQYRAMIDAGEQLLAARPDRRAA
jgi:hypothetical protein